MGERVRLAFEREPSFFRAAAIAGNPMVGVLRDGETVIGVGTRTLSEAYVNGKLVRHGYLADLRLREEYRGGLWLARGYKVFRDWHRDGMTQLYHTVIFADNHPALKTVAANRPGMPKYVDMGVVHCPAILLGRKKPPSCGSLDIRPADLKSMPEVVDCLNRNHARRQFAPTHRVSDFPALRIGLNPENFLVARRAGVVVGVVALWDQSAFKQTRLVSMKGIPSAAVSISEWLRRRFGTPALPRPGAPLAFFHLSFIAIDYDDRTVFDALLRRAYNSACGTRYGHFVVGLHERDPLLPSLAPYAKIAFTGRLFCVHFDDGAAAFAGLDSRPPHIETALL